MGFLIVLVFIVHLTGQEYDIAHDTWGGARWRPPDPPPVVNISEFDCPISVKTHVIPS